MCTAASSDPLSRCSGCGAQYSCWRAHRSSNGGSSTRSQSVQRPPVARCILLALSISLRQATSLRLPDTARPRSCHEGAHIFTGIHRSARCSSIPCIDRHRLIIERIGVTRTNQHDAHELCGHPGAQSGSAKAMTRAAWSSGREIDCGRLASIATPASDLPYAVVCVRIQGLSRFPPP